VKKILVVDDDTLFAMLLGRMLVGEGYEVQTAGGGAEALVCGRQMTPDLLVTDWMLRDGLTGLDVASRLRQSNPRLQILIITGMSGLERAQEAKEAGVFRILEKPCALEDTLTAVREALAGV
jgi:CheY-like chemotaxis protein